jgi:hypothetical protein
VLTLAELGKRIKQTQQAIESATLYTSFYP